MGLRGKGCPVTILTLSTIALLWSSAAGADTHGCGNYEVRGHHGGALHSPGYPNNNYGTNNLCSWEISMEEGHQIKLTFLGTFHMEASSTCDYDYIELNEINPETNEVVKSTKYCGTNNPGNYISTTSLMRLRFRSDGSNEYAGFSAFWTRVGDEDEEEEEEDVEAEPCRYAFDGLEGVFTYPDRESHIVEQCSWNISAELGKVISLEFDSNFDLGVKGDNTCSGDTIEVFDVMGNTSLIRRGHWCGIEEPPVITSFGSDMRVVLHRSGGGGPKNFTARWRGVAECGGVFTAPEGYVMSYDFPYNTMPDSTTSYPPNCTWDIVIPLNYYVLLNFHQGMNESECQGLEIQDYSESDDAFYPRQNWCDPIVADDNVTSLNPLRSSSSKMRLVYQNSGEFMHGLYASWITKCGQILSTLKGNLSSPGYGIEYPPSLDCEWIIHGEKDHAVRLEFQPLFDIETSNDGSCGYDYVEILESKSDSSLESQGRFCGSQPPPVFISSSDKLVVRLHSDMSKQGKGFSMSWDTKCGDVYTALEGNITSPRFPSLYPNDIHCSWEISVPEGYTIQLAFYEPFTLEGNSDCDTDYLELYDYTTDGELSKRGRWCGHNMPPFQTSMTSRMQLVFHSDDSKNHIGFHADWESGKHCGKEFRSSHGTLTSPGYPQSYPANLRCRWEISATQGQKLKLDFGSTLDVEIDKDDCRYDGVEVMDTLYNGTLVSYGKWCSYSEIPVFYTTSKLVVLFYSDMDKSGQGFSASWEPVSGCDEKATGKTGHLLSLNYPSNYSEYQECRWEISPDGGANVTLRFDDVFDLESHPSCLYDYLEIYRGQELLGRWCGVHTPPDVTSGGETLVVIFKSDKSVTGKGFFASWN